MDIFNQIVPTETAAAILVISRLHADNRLSESEKELVFNGFSAIINAFYETAQSLETEKERIDYLLQILRETHTYQVQLSEQADGMAEALFGAVRAAR